MFDTPNVFFLIDVNEFRINLQDAKICQIVKHSVR